MTILDVECPECGSKPGVVCFSTDVVAGFGRVEEGHKERHEAAAWAYLHTANPPQILSLDRPQIPAQDKVGSSQVNKLVRR